MENIKPTMSICIDEDHLAERWAVYNKDRVAELEKAICIYQRERPHEEGWDDDAHAIREFIEDTKKLDNY